MSKDLNKFLKSIQEMPSSKTVFNPWRDIDRKNDLSTEAPEYRLTHLKEYLQERLKTARVILVAEAIGYKGGKFSGIPMTSERRLLEDNNRPEAEKSIFFQGAKYRTSNVRLSNGKTNAKGSLEPTATVVWKTMLEYFDSHEFVLANTFSWHPHPEGLPLKNRTPTDAEIERGEKTLKLFLAAFPDREVVAVGRKAEGTLATIGIQCHPVRHPANGGVNEFAEGIRALSGKYRKEK